MMKKSKVDLEAAQAVLTAQTAPNTLRGDLTNALKLALTDENARGLHYMIVYYGLGEQKGLTLEAIGEQVAPLGSTDKKALTRERVRQIIDNVLYMLLRKEGSAKEGHPKPYEKIKALFDATLKNRAFPFLRLSEFVKDPYLLSYENDPKGLVSFLNDAGIRQVVYRNEHYIYPENISRQDAIAHVQAENKKVRRAQTMEKVERMAKTVTYVPKETRSSLSALAKKDKVPLNRLYEQILESFMTDTPYNGSIDFEKTQSWRARQGKAEWQQVGIYIDRELFEKVKNKANTVTPEPVSNMSYICQAFIWFAKQQPEEASKV